MIDPKEGKKYERDPSEGDIPSGVYLAELSRVQEVGPSAKYPQGNNRLVFEFTIVDPSYPNLGGKKAVVFLGKTLHKSRDGKEANLVKWGRMMGVVNPEKGFDPDMLLGKKYQTTIEYTDGINGEPGRGWVRMAILASVGNPGPAPFPSSGPDPAALWDYSDGAAVVQRATTAAVQQFLTDNRVAANKINVKLAGSPRESAKTADLWGFASGDAIPF